MGRVIAALRSLGLRSSFCWYWTAGELGTSGTHDRPALDIPESRIGVGKRDMPPLVLVLSHSIDGWMVGASVVR